MTDPADFSPRFAVVTGGNSGIGQSTCIALAERLGVDVGFTFHEDEQGAKLTKREIEKRGRRAVYRQADFSRLPGPERVVDQLAADLGGLDIFVANAGEEKLGWALDISYEDWMWTVNLCLTGAFLTMQRAANIMVRQGRGGRIIAVTSVHEQSPQHEGVAYVAAKHGLGGVVKSMALEITPLHGITINAIAPGAINVDVEDIAAATGKAHGEVRRDRDAAIPLTRRGYPREIADVICLLASAQASYVTGASWLVDGGFQVMTPLASKMYRRKYMPEK